MHLTELLHRAQRGDTDAADALFAATYPRLRQMARARLGRGARLVELDTGSLVHESYMRFAEAGALSLADRIHFFRWAGRVMRSVVVDIARRARAQRRGGDAPHVELPADLGTSAAGADEVLMIHEALHDLAAAAPRLAQVVELRYFAGLTEAEVAEVLGVTERTVRRDWDKARLLLHEALG